MAITFKVGFQVDDKKMKDSLAGIQNDINNAFQIKGGMSTEIQKATQQAMVLEKAMKRATTDKGISYYSLQSELNKAGTSAEKLTATLAAGGKNFAASLNAANSALATADRSLVSLNSKIKEMSRVLTQSFKFTAAQTFLQAISQSAREAYQWVYELDKTVTNIGVVTGYTGDQLDKVTKNAIAGAKELRIAANDYAEGALIFYQQGLGDDEVAKRVEITAKSARAAGQSLDQMSSQLTAIWNTYKMTGDEMQRAASVGAKMAGDTAVDFADIAEAMQTAAAPAEQMGVSYNSLAAIIATVGDTTQQSASVIGNAFKTIFSRFQQLKSEGTDGEVTLNRVSSQLQELGVNVLDAGGELRNLDSVIAEVGGQWDSWSSKQQLAIAQLVGGTRQYGQFLTLMNNFDKYQDLLNSANLEDGSTLEQQYQSSLDSIESHAQNAGEAWRRAFGSLIDEDAVKTVYSIVEGLGNTLNTIFTTLGGSRGILLAVSAILARQIVPATAQAAKNAAMMFSNRSAKNREANINKEYSKMNSRLDVQIGKTNNKDTIADLQTQKQKNEFSRNTAIINDQINTKLKTATGEYRIQLQYQQQQLKSSQDLYQASVDRLNNLSKQVDKEKEMISLEEEKARREQAKAQARVDNQKQKVAEAQAKVDSFESRDGMFYEGVEKDIKGLTDDDLASMGVTRKDYEDYAKAVQNLRHETELYLEVSDELAETNFDVEYAQGITKVEQGFKEATQAVADFKSKFEERDENGNLTKDATDSLDAAQESLSNLGNSLKERLTRGLSGDEISEPIQQQINKIDEALADMGDGSEESLTKVLSALEEVATQAGVSTDRIRELVAETVDATADAETARSGQSQSGNLDRDVEAEERISGTNYAGVVEGLVEVTGAAGAAASAVSGFNSVLQDSDASAFEKVTSGIAMLSSVVPLLGLAQGGILKMAAACGVEAAAAEGATLKTVFLGEAGKSAFATMAPVILPIIVAIGAVAAGVAVLNHYFNNMTAEAKLEKMNQAAQDLANSAEEAKNKADGLRSSIENYNSAVSTLNNCVSGTEEWKEALEATNDAALQVIDSLTEMGNVDLSNLYQRDKETGMLTLDPEELEKAQENADKLANSKEYAAQMAKASASMQKNTVDAKNIADDFDLGNDAASIGVAAGGGAAAGALIGSVVPVVGTAIGALTGAVVGAVAAGVPTAIERDLQDAEVGKKIEENIEELVTLDDSTLKDKLASFGMDVQNLSDTEFAALRQRLDSLAQSTAAAQERLEMIAGLAVDEQLGDKYSGEAKDMVTKQVAADQTRLEDEWTTFMDDNFSKISDGSEEDRQKLLDAFNAAMGTNYTADGNFSRGTDDNRTFAFRNEVTGEVETFTKEYIASTIAAQQALEGLEVSAKEAENMLKNLSVVDAEGNKDDGATQAIRDFISTGNLEGATQGEFETIQQGVKDAGNAQAYLESIGFTPEVAEQYAADFEAALDIDWTSVTAKLPESFKEAEDLSLSQARGFGETYQKIIGIAGEEAGKQYEGMMNGILDQIDSEEDKQKAMDILSGIDWTQWDAADQAAKAMKEMGYEIDTSAESWITFTNNMRETFKAIPDLDSLITQMQQVKEIAEGVELGSILSKEDYETLVNYNSELSKYFMILADGSAQMMGDPLDFMQEVERSGQQALKDTIAQYKQMEQELEGVSGSQNYKGSNDKNYYRGNNVQTQLDYIQASGTVDQSQIDAWREDLADGQSTVETIDAIGEAFDALGQSSEIAAAKASQAMTELAMTASSAEERMQMLESGDIDEVAYAQASMAAINEEKWEGFSQEDIEGVQDYANHLQDVADSSELVSDELKNNEEAAEDVAREVTKMNRGIETLAEGFEDWSDILKNSDKSSQEYSEAMDNMKEAMSDVLGVSEEFLSDDFILDNMEDIKLAAEGDADAIDRLAIAAARDIIVHMDIQDETLKQKVLGLHDELAAMTPDIEVGATLNSGDFYAKAQELVDTAGMSVEQAQAYFNSLGYEPVFEMRNETRTAPMYGKRVYSDDPVMGYAEGPNGEQYPYIKELTTHEEEVYMGEQEQNFVVPALSPDGTPKIKEIRKTSNGAMNNFSSSNKGGGSPKGSKSSGGGGSAPKHQAIKAKKYESMKKDDRYSTIKASIEEVQKSLDKYNDAVDDSWGSAKIRALQQANRELERQAKDYQALYKSAKSYLSIDQKEATKNKKDLGKKLGLNLIDPTFNKDGFLSNKTEVINQLDDYLQTLYQKYYDAAQKYDADKSTDEKRKERIDQMLEEYNVAKEAVDEYISSLDQVDETANEAHEALMKLVEGIRQEIAYRVEEITYKMEFRIKINDRDIEWFEHIIDKMGDVGLITGKSFEQIVKSFNSSASSVQTAADTFKDLQDLLASLNTKEGQQDFIAKFGQEAWDYYLATGKLSAEVIEGMSDVYDQAFDALKQAYDDFDAMFEQYLSLLDIYLSEFDRFSNQISRQSDQLEAYRQLLDFSGKGYGEDGRAARKSLSDAQISNAKTELARAQSVAKMLEGSVKDSEERLQEFYDTYGKDPSGWDTATAHAFNQIKQTHDEIVSQYEDAQSDITAALTDVIDAATEALEDGHERITEAFVEGFNGLFTSLDSALTQYEWKTDIRDFYLDDYDKNYELDKLLGEIDDAMTDVTDPERLQAWSALQDEINAKMAEGVKITQTDLDILRAQFELEQAKDQYEEAKNAKNTMRLARDASGNWNYVYSSESSEAEDAEQKMKDAMANIHKMHREAADSMSDLWYQTYIEMEKYEYEVDQLRYKNDEQYRAEVNEFRRLYKEKLDFYESEVIKHNGAIDRSFADTVLGQQTGYDTMEEAADAYYQANEQYTKELQDNANEYEETIRETCDMVGISYEQLEQWIRDRANNIMQSNDDMAGKMEETSIRGSAALGNLSDNIDTYAWSMIESLRALELQVESLYNTLQTLSDWEANVGMNADFGTDYTDYIGTDFYNKYGKDATANDVKDYMSSAEVQQLIKERLYVMQNDPNRGEWYDPETAYEDVYNEVYNSLMAILKDIQNDKGYWTDDNWNFGENGSTKKKRTASGGLIKTPQVRSLAEEGPELVLNKDDTQNILEAVKNMRETIKLKISAMNSSIGQKVQGETITTQSNVETIEQNVKIDATFPGVSVASEIEEALNNLINQAVQYAHKNNR